MPKKIKDNKTIVIVEDSPVQAELLRRILSKEGYELKIAKDGKEGLAMLRESLPDLVISDITMPEMDGYELCRQIKNDKYLSHIPVILLTQLSDIGDLVKGLEAKADTYITKPYNNSNLLSKVAMMLSDSSHHKKVEIDRIGTEVSIKTNLFKTGYDMKQVLSYLLSTYENAIEQNKELVRTQMELKGLNEKLEDKVRERTRELEDSEKRLELLMQTVPDIIYRIDVDGNFTYLNQAVRKLGFTSEELMGKHFSKIVDPEDFQKISRDSVLAELKGKKTGDASSPKFIDERRTGDRSTKGLEVKLVSKENDTPIVVEINSSGMYELRGEGNGIEFVGSFGVIKSKESGFLGASGVIRDITERKLAEEILRESEERYRSVVETANDAFITVNENNNIISWNRAARTIFGYSFEEVSEKSLSMIIPERYREAHKKGIERVLSGGKSNVIGKTVELTGLKKDGSEFPVELSLTSWKRREKVFFTGIIRDITLRKLSEEERVQSNAILRKTMKGIIDTMAMTVEVKDPYTAGHQRRVSDLARAIGDKMGLSRNEVDGIRMASVIHDIGKVQVPSEILNKPGKISKYEYEMIKSHSKAGYELLKTIDFPWPVANIVYEHHEKMDGSGYPRGLKGEDIMIEARIICVADVVEAMSSHRPYRAALGMDAALEEIEKKRGISYDSEVVDACVKIIRENGFVFK